jgi:hypothetical protein
LTDHFRELPHNLIIGGIQLTAGIIIQILALPGELEPHLRFTGLAFGIV